MQTNNLRPVPTKNDRNAPSAAVNATDDWLWLNINSPTNAPMNGPNNGPIGNGRNNPTTRPIIAPQLPALLPPNRFVIHGVSQKSMTVTAIVIRPNIISEVVEKSIYPLHFVKSIAINANGGPGNAGITQPNTPPMISTIANTINNISIYRENYNIVMFDILDKGTKKG